MLVKKKNLCIQKLLCSFPNVYKHQNNPKYSKWWFSFSILKVYFCLELLHGTNIDSLLLLYSRYIVFVWTSYCLLHVNGLLTMYGVMRPWVQGQLWYMRVKIGLCCTDDLISIFRDLGMEMTLFTFKCFVLAPGLLYLCLIPVHRRSRSLHTESAHWLVWNPPNYNIHCRHSKVYKHQAACMERERERESIWREESPSSFSVQLTWCMHSRK